MKIRTHFEKDILNFQKISMIVPVFIEKNYPSSELWNIKWMKKVRTMELSEYNLYFHQHGAPPHHASAVASDSTTVSWYMDWQTRCNGIARTVARLNYFSLGAIKRVKCKKSNLQMF